MKEVKLIEDIIASAERNDIDLDEYLAGYGTPEYVGLVADAYRDAKECGSDYLTIACHMRDDEIDPMLNAIRKFGFTEFAVTNTRFVQKDGIFNIKMTEIPLARIETVNFYQSLWQRIIGTGCVEMVGSGGTSHQVHCIEQPMKVRKIICAAIKKPVPNQNTPSTQNTPTNPTTPNPQNNETANN